MNLLCRIGLHRWTAFYDLEACPVEYRRCERCGWVRHACSEIDWSKVAASQGGNDGGRG
jgi:hypothetical protein